MGGGREAGERTELDCVQGRNLAAHRLHREDGYLIADIAGGATDESAPLPVRLSRSELTRRRPGALVSNQSYRDG